MNQLREDILDYMRYEKGNKNEILCTWWFKFHIPHATKAIRRELEKMEREGLVTSDRSQPGNTKWAMVTE